MTLKDLHLSPETLERARRLTGANSDEEAVEKLVVQYVGGGSQKDLIRFMGKSDTFMTLGELDEMRSQD